MTGTIVAAHDLRKRYGELQAVDGVSFEIAEREVFGILGPNGAGKTTTVKILLGLVRPTSGQARLFGRPAPFVRPPDAGRSTNWHCVLMSIGHAPFAN